MDQVAPQRQSRGRVLYSVLQTFSVKATFLAHYLQWKRVTLVVDDTLTSVVLHFPSETAKSSSLIDDTRSAQILHCFSSRRHFAFLPLKGEIRSF